MRRRLARHRHESIRRIGCSRENVDPIERLPAVRRPAVYHLYLARKAGSAGDPVRLQPG